MSRDCFVFLCAFGRQWLTYYYIPQLVRAEWWTAGPDTKAPSRFLTCFSHSMSQEWACPKHLKILKGMSQERASIKPTAQLPKQAHKRTAHGMHAASCTILCMHGIHILHLLQKGRAIKLLEKLQLG